MTSGVIPKLLGCSKILETPLPSLANGTSVNDGSKHVVVLGAWSGPVSGITDQVHK